MASTPHSSGDGGGGGGAATISGTSYSGGAGGGSFVARAARGSSLEKLLHDLRLGLFASYFVLQKKITPHRWLSIAGSVIRLMQMIVFPLHAAGHAWHPGTIKPLQSVVTVPSIGSWFSDGVAPSTMYFGMFYFSVAWVVIYATLQGWALASFVRGQIPSIAVLKFLRSIANISATIAFIPLFTLLMSSLACRPTHGDAHDDGHGESPWEHAGFHCFEGTHLGLSILAAVLAAALLAMCALFALFFFDAHPLSSNLAARAHGRTDFALLLLKSALVVLFEVLGARLGSWALAGIALGSGVLWVSLTIFTMPHLHHSMNAWYAASSSMYTAVGLCAICALAYPGFDAAVMIYVCLPLAAVFGIWLADVRRRRVLTTPVWDLWSPFEAELKARYIIQAAVDVTLHPRSSIWRAWLPASRKSESMSLLGATVRHSSAAVAPIDAQHSDSESFMEWATEGEPEQAGQQSGTAGGEANGSADSIDTDAWRLAYDVMDGDTRADFMRERLPGDAIMAAAAVLRQAVARFPHSPILHVFFARFAGAFRANRQQMMGHLMQAHRLGAPLDVAFLVYVAHRVADSSAPSDVSNALNRVTFEKYFGRARHAVQIAAEAQVALWTELSGPAPQVDRLHRLTAALARASRHADTSFAELFAVEPQSIAGLRLLAQFHIVNGNADRAATLLEECERLEDQKARMAHATSAHNIERSFGIRFVMEPHMEIDDADNVGVMAVGASSRDLGVILSANAQACRTLGYSKLQIERRNLSLLLPRPLSTLYESNLRDYISTGESELVGSTRAVLARHRAGYVFPALLGVRDAAAEDASPSFTCLLRAVPSPDRFIVVDASLTVTAACSLSQDALNITAEQLGDGIVRVDHVVSSWHNVWQAAIRAHANGDTGATSSRAGNTSTRAQRNGRGVPITFTPMPPVADAGTEDRAAATLDTPVRSRAGLGLTLRAPRQERLRATCVVQPIRGNRGVIGCIIVWRPSDARRQSAVATPLVADARLATPMPDQSAPQSASVRSPNARSPGHEAPHASVRPMIISTGLQDQQTAAQRAPASPSGPPTDSRDRATVSALRPIRAPTAAKRRSHGGVSFQPESHCQAPTSPVLLADAPPNTLLPEVPDDESHHPNAVGRGNSVDHLLNSVMRTTSLASDAATAGPQGAPAAGIAHPGLPPRSRSPAHPAIRQSAPFADTGMPATRRELSSDGMRGAMEQLRGADSSRSRLLDGSRSVTLTDAGSPTPKSPPPLCGTQDIAGQSSEVVGRSNSGSDEGLHTHAVARATASVPSTTMRGSATTVDGTFRHGSCDNVRDAGRSGDWEVGSGHGADHAKGNASIASSSKSYSRAAMNRLRKALTSAPLAGFSLPVLRQVRMAFRVVVVLNVVLAVAVGASLASYMSVYASSLAVTSSATVAVSHILWGITTMRERLSVARGWLPGDASADAVLVNRLSTSASAISHAADALFDLARTGRSPTLSSQLALLADVFDYDYATSVDRSSLTDTQVAAMKPAGVEMPYSVEGTNIVLLASSEPVQVLAGMYTMSAKLADVAAVPLANLTSTLRSIPFVHVNGFSGSSLHEETHHLIQHVSYDDSRAAYSTDEALATGLFVSAAVLVLLLLVFLILPALSRVSQARDSIMLAFVDIPKPALAVLRVAAEQRLRAVQAGNPDDEFDEDDDDGDEEQTGEVLDSVADGRPQREAAALRDDADAFGSDGAVDWDALIGVHGGQGPYGRAGGRRWSSHGPGSPSTSLPLPRLSGHLAMSPSAGTPGGKYAVGKTPRAGLAATEEGGDWKAKLLVWLRVHLGYARFSLPLLALIVFYAIIFAVTLTTLRQLNNLLAISTYTGARVTEIAELTMNVEVALSYTGYPSETTDLVHNARDTLAILRAHQRYLLYHVPPEMVAAWDGYSAGSLPFEIAGSENTGFPELSATDNDFIRHAMLHDGCDALVQALQASGGVAGVMTDYADASIGATSASCKRFRQGVITAGLSAVFDDLFVVARRLLARRAASTVDPMTGLGFLNTSMVPGMLPNGSIPFSVSTELDSSDARAFHVLARDVLAPSMSLLMDRIQDRAQSLVRDYNLFIGIFIGLFFAGYIVYTLVSYMPGIRALDADVVAKRSLLLLLPPELVQKLPSLRDEANRILVDAGLRGWPSHGESSAANRMAAAALAVAAASAGHPLSSSTVSDPQHANTLPGWPTLSPAVVV